MLSNYLKTIWRNLYKHKGFSFINIFGLSVGMACCFLLLVFARIEFSFDGFHSKSDRIYRLATEVHLRSGQINDLAFSASPAGASLVAAFPEVEQATRVARREGILRRETNRRIEMVNFVDSTFFDVFDFRLEEGNPAYALRDPGSLLLTREMAERYFGQEDPMGRELTFADSLRFIVTGILADIPPNSHLRFSFLASYHSLPVQQSNEWGRLGLWTYLLLTENASAVSLEARLPDWAESAIGAWGSEIF